MNEKRNLRRLVNTGKIPLKDVYYLIIQASISNRKAKHSVTLHDKYYDDSICNLAHVYLSLEK